MEDTLPVVEPPSEYEADSVVAGVLLAAGMSTRYGDENKLLTKLDSSSSRAIDDSNKTRRSDGIPIVRQSAMTLIDAGLDPVVVIVGHQSTKVMEALTGLDVTIVENPDYESGQGSSVRAGIRALGTDDNAVEAAVFALGDMPFIRPESVRALVSAYEAGVGSALAAGYNNDRGNPVLFDRKHFPNLADCKGDVGGKHVLLSVDDAVIVNTGDPGVLRDINQREDHI
ncbi:nucleotidyltransferase family protein [Haloparvum sedimenti]|uniref:nucleotidyltransferase family protein n=1 Tax=Haloparvum sedimenti TaxID=1678448 RepID=UPI0009B5C243|nr:nucleotidyltransferase family protein [Haloparvum sedimenti]